MIPQMEEWEEEKYHLGKGHEISCLPPPSAVRVVWGVNLSYQIQGRDKEEERPDMYLKQKRKVVPR